ncbi:putative phosphatidate phosphatase [Drosophila hydei]|uniref:Phosphatidate phosphatase n=1 Tax=Drosophila hydei TaxID=7224 RepID=A0A6J2STW2_DROHY|nr:putative phosphatidate phosphatase [Drosophila hydei]
MSFDLQINGLFPNRGQFRLLLDVALLSLMILLSTYFKELWLPTTQRGFFCDDESLMYPYRENTVSSSMLHWISIYLPMMALLALETSRSWLGCRQYWRVYNTLRWFIMGCAAESLLKDMGKNVIGRLRPHFFEVCRPQLPDGGYCSDAAHRQGGVYHTVYGCNADLSGATEEMLLDIHVSFPSGHSSKAFYGLVFMALHLQRIRWPLPGSLLRPVCQLFCICLASFVGLSRVMDYKHHWSDVAAGSLLGAAIAFAAVRAAGLDEKLHLESSKGQHANSLPSKTAAAAAAAAVGIAIAVAITTLRIIYS